LNSLIVLWKKMAEESAIWCHTSATMDIKTVQGRYKHEGMSFLTISLPRFGKDFQKSLDQGLVDRNMFQGFSWHAGLPRFLGGFLDRVFDRTSGILHDHPDIDAILCIRQLTLIYSKILLDCSQERVEKAMSDYVMCEQEVRASDTVLSESDLSDFERISQMLYARVFSEVDREIYNVELVPKHGPGATVDRLIGNEKYRLRTWTSRLEEVFPAMDYLFPNPSYYFDEIDAVDFLEPGAEMPVKVITVPKTQKSPRIIAIEPAAMQYAQQSILEAIVPRLESDSLLSKMIGFSDQEPNQLDAQKGSLYGDLATLDLSEASDRVSNQLVRAMLRHHPHLHKGVDACRSRRARVPGHGVIRLAKFASMGSALCFPFEAMVFLTIIILGIEKERRIHFDRHTIKSFADQVRVYGDDLIVPVDCVHSVINSLELFGARVGADKSYWTGRFRESCGKEFYEGHDVSIVKVRREFPVSRKNVQEVISLVSLRNQLYKAGYWRTVKWLDHKLENLLGFFPYVEETSSLLGRYSFLGYNLSESRMDEHHHAPVVKGYVVSPRLPINRLDGPGALLKFFLKRGVEPVHDVKHLERSGRPRAVDTKPRWARPY